MVEWFCCRRASRKSYCNTILSTFASLSLHELTTSPLQAATKGGIDILVGRAVTAARDVVNLLLALISDGPTPALQQQRMDQLTSLVITGLAAPGDHPALGLAAVLPHLNHSRLESAPEWQVLGLGLGGGKVQVKDPDADLLRICSRLGIWHRWPCQNV